MENLKLNSDNQ